MFRLRRLTTCPPRIVQRRLALALVMTSITAIAMAKPENVTKEEMAVIPHYCREAMDPNAQGLPAYWAYVTRLGLGFRAIHHYCWGHINQLRAMRSSTPQRDRVFLLSNVRADFIYVVKNSPPDFILLPEVYTRIGQVELLQSLPHDANKSFAQARALKPDYWPAYSHWADFLIRTGKKTEAMQLVKSGLEYSPKSRMLIDQYRQLGGNPSQVVPKVKEKGADEATGTPIKEEITSADESPVE